MSLITRIKIIFHDPKGRTAGLWWTYFFYWGSLAPFIPYVGLYYESVGLTGTQIGQLGSVRSIISFASAILLAFLSDTPPQTKTLSSCYVFAAMIVLMILLSSDDVLCYPRSQSSPSTQLFKRRPSPSSTETPCSPGKSARLQQSAHLRFLWLGYPHLLRRPAVWTGPACR